MKKRIGKEKNDLPSSIYGKKRKVRKKIVFPYLRSTEKQNKEGERKDKIIYFPHCTGKKKT